MPWFLTFVWLLHYADPLLGWVAGSTIAEVLGHQSSNSCQGERTWSVLFGSIQPWAARYSWSNHWLISTSAGCHTTFCFVSCPCQLDFTSWFLILHWPCAVAWSRDFSHQSFTLSRLSLASRTQRLAGYCLVVENELDSAIRSWGRHAIHRFS